MEQAVSHNDDAYESPGIRALRLSVQQLAAQVQQLQANDHARANELRAIREMIEDSDQH